MFNLSRQEKIVFLFIISVLLAIFSWKLYSKERNNITIVPAVTSLENSIEEENKIVEENICIIHIAGAVHKPGVYQLNDDERIIDAVKIAGGATEQANVDAVNLAAHIYDGQKIVIPFNVEENDEINKQNLTTSKTFEQYQYSSNSNLINLNTANSHQLETLPGIGPVLAKSILDYREKYGLFRDIKNIQDVSGIGEKRFESIKEYITVY
jgi:competence protein ComEA